MLSYVKRLLNFNMNVLNKNKTIVVVLGATGTGKSKLAIEIAKKYNGEIINADSMQIYKGLDIATNKISEEERKTVSHHMLDFQDPLQYYNVVNFQSDVLPIIEKIHSNRKLPVIVGGTHYYIESILWNVLIQSQCFKSADNQTESCVSKYGIIRRINLIKNFLSANISDRNVDNFLKDFNSIINVKCAENSDHSTLLLANDGKSHCKDCSCNISFALETVIKLLKLLKNDSLLKLLEEIDPDIAKTYHPNNTRKILRSVEVWIQTGVRHSEHMRKQVEEVGGVDLGGNIRFQNTALLWIKCDQEILDKRLDERVDAMIKQGLLKELSEFRTLYYPLISKFHTEFLLKNQKMDKKLQKNKNKDSSCSKEDKYNNENSEAKTAQLISVDVVKEESTARNDSILKAKEIETCDSGCSGVNLQENAIESMSSDEKIEVDKVNEDGNAIQQSLKDPLNKESSFDSSAEWKSGLSKVSLDWLKDEEIYKLGIFQCIGLKEFLDYLQLDEEEQLSQKGQNTYSQALKTMKLRTRQYSRRQCKWIKNRFLIRSRMKIPVYALDGTDVSNWNENVSHAADEIVKSFLNGKKPITPPMELQATEKKNALCLGDKTSYFCDICSRVFIGTHQWNDHLGSSKHRNMLKRSSLKEQDLKKIQKVI